MGSTFPDSDEQAITITYGSAKDHRPDLKKAVLELMVSQDGGVPFGGKSWEGNTSDIKVFQERAQALVAAFQNAPSPRYLIADSKLYREDNAPNLPRARLYHTDSQHPGSVSQVIAQALASDAGTHCDDNTRYQCLA